MTSHSYPPLRATYRLQFHRGFTLRQATALVPYLSELGISHVYASPLLCAQPGSMHGYDVVDPTRLNPEIGTEDDLRSFVDALHRSRMGMLLDIVPNHMSIGGAQNRWWWDVLRKGRESRYAGFFDVDWETSDPELHGRILLPVLGASCEEVVNRGELKCEPGTDGPVIRYHQREFPIRPDSLPDAVQSSPEGLSAETDTPAKWLSLLEKQHYLLTNWREGDQRLNYRRFFTITDLAGVRVEDPAVFEKTHAQILGWCRDGWVQGLRIDHPDGLRDPEAYLHRVREAAPKAWITVEKILMPEEKLPPSWPVAGTTGYDILNRMNQLLIDPAGEEPLSRFYGEFTRDSLDLSGVIRDRKKRILEEALAAEVTRLMSILQGLVAANGLVKRLDDDSWRRALIEFTACFPVYRSYVRAESGAISETDKAYITRASLLARSHLPECSAGFDFLEELLLLEVPGPGVAEFVMRFQQLTGPAMAKGVEDTAFYSYNRFIALNEVGGDPGSFGSTVERFHQDCIQFQKEWPMSQVATSTHDTKRSEDVRARLALLSEIPSAWMDAVRRWAGIGAKYKSGSYPDRNAEYHFYQSLVGTWPIPVERMTDYMIKAAREAKQYTSWAEPAGSYEDGLREFIKGMMGDHAFTADVEQFTAELMEAGWINSLAQTLLKLTTPGVPDIYQGTELWDFSLVDPDNRRPVDFEARLALLDAARTAEAEEAWVRRQEGLPKVWLIHRTLRFRASRPDLFDESADYTPLPAEGNQTGHCVAFARAGDVITVVPRLSFGLRGGWTDTWLALPEGSWLNQLTGESWAGGPTPLASILRRFPVALLSRAADAPGASAGPGLERQRFK